MDTTPQYIEMCRKAGEIQEAWEPCWGDFISDIADPSWAVVLISHSKQIIEIGFNKIKHLLPPNPNKEKDWTWVLRQDQLQALVLDTTWARTQVAFYDFIFEIATKMCPEHFKNLCLVDALADFKDDGMIYEKSIEAIEKTWNSFEQAWLAFVMSEKYNKVWDDKLKDWVDETISH